MSALGWAGLGAFGMFGLLVALGVYVVFLFTRNAQIAFESLAIFVRLVVNATGFRSVVVSRDPEPRVIAFEDVASALERGDVLSHAPVRVHRSEPPPACSSADGGYDGRH